MSRQFDFQNLDLYSCQDFDNLRVATLEPLKTLVGTADEPIPAQTADQEEEFFYQRSALIPTESFEISFEKEFMREHEAAFLKELKNHLESFRIYAAKKGILFLHQNELILKTQNRKISCIQFIKTHDFGISLNQAQKFIDKFTKFDKLSEFLSFIVSTCSQKMSIQLIKMAKEILEKYQEIQIQLPSQEELLKLAHNIARCSKFFAIINLKGIALTKCQEATNLIQSSRKLMEVYCATTILVVGQYFENPFYSDQEIDCFKRQLSPWCCQDDEMIREFNSKPAKKRKFTI